MSMQIDEAVVRRFIEIISEHAKLRQWRRLARRAAAVLPQPGTTET